MRTSRCHPSPVAIRLRSAREKRFPQQGHSASKGDNPSMRILGRRSGTGVLRVEGYGDIGVGYQLEVCSDGGIKSAEGTMRGDMTKLMQAWFSGNDRQRLVLEEGTAIDVVMTELDGMTTR